MKALLIDRNNFQCIIDLPDDRTDIHMPYVDIRRLRAGLTREEMNEGVLSERILDSTFVKTGFTEIKGKKIPIFTEQY